MSGTARRRHPHAGRLPMIVSLCLVARVLPGKDAITAPQMRGFFYCLAGVCSLSPAPGAGDCTRKVLAPYKALRPVVCTRHETGPFSERRHDQGRPVSGFPAIRETPSGAWSTPAVANKKRTGHPIGSRAHNSNGNGRENPLRPDWPKA